MTGLRKAQVQCEWNATQQNQMPSVFVVGRCDKKQFAQRLKQIDLLTLTQEACQSLLFLEPRQTPCADIYSVLVPETTDALSALGGCFDVSQHKCTTQCCLLLEQGCELELVCIYCILCSHTTIFAA